ncbi:MAG: hypothetical protein K8S98_18110, partial [Planctomycetes bacterium]|nr:hypothetical protein [Planctomycetota bacterium]
MAILSPTNHDGGYPGASPQPNGTWRTVTTCDYLGFMMKGAALEECGFLNPDFKYCWGAIHELAYKLYSRGWFVAYDDQVSYRHLGGTTYGAKGTNTISRDEYQRRAKRFAFDYFREHYGDAWEELFWNAALPFAPAVDTFAEHKRYWASAFTSEELAARGASEKHVAPKSARRLLPSDGPDRVKLHLGCGPEKRAGWINIDTQAAVRPDIVSSVDHLPMFPDASVDVMREWARLLKPGGELYLELPDLDACIRILGRHRDDQGFDVGLIGIFGWPPAIEREGVPQLHKWGWTKASLAEHLREAGFSGVEFGPITQVWRVAAKVGRDLRLCATKGLPTTRAELAHGGPAEEHAEPRRAQLFAWPDWSDARELEALLANFGATIARTPHARFVLRFDELFDGDRNSALAALRVAHAKTLGDATELDVLFLDAPLEPEDWERLGRSMSAVAELPSSAREPRRASFLALGAPLVADADAFVRVATHATSAIAS